MKKTSLEKQEERKLVSDYMNTVADLSVENTRIVWMAGLYIAVLLGALMVASYYVSVQTLAWLVYLMPLGAFMISRKYRIRRTVADIQFHLIWQNMWGMAAVLAIVPCLYDGLSVNGIFAVYYIVLAVGTVVFLELMRLRYASIVFALAIGIVLTGIRTALDDETSIRWCLGSFFLFDLILFLLSGVAMQWQVKNRVKNPVNFPQPKE